MTQLTAEQKAGQDWIISNKNPAMACDFARDFPGADIKALERVVLDVGRGLEILRFARDIPGADIEALGQATIERGTAWDALEFAQSVTGADIEALRKFVAERGGEVENQAFQRKFPVVMTLGEIASKAAAIHAEADPLDDTKPMRAVSDGFDLPSSTLTRQVDMPLFPGDNELATLTLDGEVRDGYAVRARIEFMQDGAVNDVMVSVFKPGKPGETTSVIPSEQALGKTPQELEAIVLQSTEKLIERYEIRQKFTSELTGGYCDPERCGGPSTQLLM